MARIRAIEIERFRSIEKLSWYPANGVNCLIGPGDSGKSTIVDAIDYCIGGRRNLQFSDVDFHLMNVDNPLTIAVTLGELDDVLKDMDAYGIYLRGYDATTHVIEDEPGTEVETVLTVRLTVGSDLEPTWTLVSERADTLGATKNLSWADRVRIAPTRIGAGGDYHLSWRRGSVLNHVTDQTTNAGSALVSAVREMRTAFGNTAETQVAETLRTVEATAVELGINVGKEVHALLDAQSLSVSGGTITLHNEGGVPLSRLGTGSTRLLIAGLQRSAADNSSIILIDELELGLEPHRIVRLLGSLGAKEAQSPLQVFMTTHSPVAVRELSGKQLFVTRCRARDHEVVEVGTEDEIQGTIRLFPEAFLATSVIVCEGASEVGLMRGLDHFRTGKGDNAMAAKGVSLVDGGGADKLFKRTEPFRKLGYRTAVVMDGDIAAANKVAEEIAKSGVFVVRWLDGRALEDELFSSLSHNGAVKLLEWAVERHGRELVDEHIASASFGKMRLEEIQLEATQGDWSVETRAVLATAAKSNKSGWFKSISAMEEVAREIVGPDLQNAGASLRDRIEEIFSWTTDAKR